MSEKTESQDGRNRDDETMSRLLRLSGGRSEIPPDIEARVYKQVESEWKASSNPPDGSRIYDKVHRAWSRTSGLNSGLRWAMPLVVAASAVLIVAVIIQPAPEIPSMVPVGTVTRIVGDTGSSGMPAFGHTVYPGERIVTGPGDGIGLTLMTAESLRIDEDSELIIEGRDRFRLVHGRIYADTGDFMYRDGHLVIETDHGEVTDIGTQFSVLVSDGSLEVGVREGRVDVKRAGVDWTSVAGERMQLSAGATEPQVQLVEPYDEYWRWTSSLAPTFNIENRSLLDFLRWAARETGRKLEFVDQGLRMAAMRTELHGSVSDLAPIEAIESVLATTSFHYRIEDDKIVILH